MKIGKFIKDKKVAIGVIDHHSLQVERPEDIADHIREALNYIPVERLIISSDCGMGREGMSRRHARYKMVSLVLGTNIIRKELDKYGKKVSQKKEIIALSKADLILNNKKNFVKNLEDKLGKKTYVFSSHLHEGIDELTDELFKQCE